MKETFLKVWSLLDRPKRLRFTLLVGASFILGFFEALGVIAILPFVAIVARPEIVEYSPLVGSIYDLSGAASRTEFLTRMGYIVLTAIVAGSFIRWCIKYAIDRFVAFLNISLSTRLLGRYIDDDYIDGVSRHSSTSERMILAEVSSVTAGTVSRLLTVCSDAVVITCIFLLLLVINAHVTLTISAILVVGYGSAFLVMRKPLLRLGEKRRSSTKKKYRAAREVMSGLREVKMYDLEEASRARLDAACRESAEAKLLFNQLGRVPRHILEIILLGGIVTYVLWLLRAQEDELLGSLPAMGVFALAALRLLPGMQRLFRGVIGLRSNRPALDQLLRQLHATPARAPRPAPVAERPPLRLTDTLSFENVWFQYPDRSEAAIEDISFTLKAGERLAFVGETGAGKSTVIGVLAGLLRPRAGRFLVDGTVIDGTNDAAWRRSVGYVPQSVFHFDESIAQNVALAKEPHQIDRARVLDLLELAGLRTFIDHLPEGIDTRIGERASKLSGGQSQRLALARALYRDPDLLILDEATNALDPITENDVLNALSGLDRRLTIVSIAHRLNTVRTSDRIILMEHGRMVESGSFDDLLSKNETFRRMRQLT